MMKKLVLYLLLLGFLFIWFVPMNIGWRGESSVCKFRFQVFECDWHDYGGNGDFYDWLISAKPEKYGTLVLYDKIGGWQEYFGLKAIDMDKRGRE